MGGVGNGFDPNITFLEQVDQLFHRDSAVDRPFDDILAFIECNLACSAAYITEIGVCHFSGAVDDATHDRDLYAFQMVRDRPNPCGRLLEVEESTTTAGTGDIFRSRDPGPRSLQDGKGSIVQKLMVVCHLQVGAAADAGVPDLRGIVWQP